MNDENNNDDKYMEIVPAHVKNELITLLQSNLSLREKWEIAKARAEAQGNARMVVADFLIEEGLMKSVFGKK
ncbi:MAG: hypothetical protein Q8M94_18220 [Ignavibacteria bacterium]|nr:hypothetical protein [Ignavibacteria bacterium]